MEALQSTLLHKRVNRHNIMLLLNINFVASGNAPEDYYDYACRRTTELEEHDPPILYDLWLDPGEADPLDSDKYSWLISKMYEVCYCDSC